MDTPRYFITPSGQSWRLDRSITRDNWLTWRHALPPVTTDCLTVRYRRLDQTTCRNITKLAAALQGLLADGLPQSSAFDESPWTVHRWWQRKDGEPFASGGACEIELHHHDVMPLIERAHGHGLQIDMLMAQVLICRLKTPYSSKPMPVNLESSSSPARS